MAPPSSVSPLHTSLNTLPCIARTGNTGLLVLLVLSWVSPPLFWSVCHVLCLHKTWVGTDYSPESPLFSPDSHALVANCYRHGRSYAQTLTRPLVCISLEPVRENVTLGIQSLSNLLIIYTVKTVKALPFFNYNTKKS